MPQRTLSNAVRLHWREAGNPAGAPIVWIHGGSVEDSSMMVPDLEPFFAELRVLLPDARGHGLSQKFERVEDYTYARKGEDVLLWLDSLGLPAVLPPPEERQHVKTAIDAAHAEQESERDRRA